MENIEIEADPGIVGAVVRNGGGELLLIPEAELRKVDEVARQMEAEPHCEHCDEAFEPRTGGGKPQRFCSPACRNAHRERGNEQRANTPTNKPRGEFVAEPGNEDKDWKAAFLALVARGKAEQQQAEAEAEDFNWSTDEDIVIANQFAIAIYANRRDQIVVREERRERGDEDAFIVIDRANIRAVIDKLCDVAGISRGGAK